MFAPHLNVDIREWNVRTRDHTEEYIRFTRALTEKM